MAEKKLTKEQSYEIILRYNQKIHDRIMGRRILDCLITGFFMVVYFFAVFFAMALVSTTLHGTELLCEVKETGCASWIYGLVSISGLGFIALLMAVSFVFINRWSTDVLNTLLPMYTEDQQKKILEKIESDVRNK